MPKYRITNTKTETDEFVGFIDGPDTMKAEEPLTLTLEPLYVIQFRDVFHCDDEWMRFTPNDDKLAGTYGDMANRVHQELLADGRDRDTIGRYSYRIVAVQA